MDLEHRAVSRHSSSMMHTIISTLLSLSLVVGLAACGGPTDGDLEASGGAAKAAARKDATCGGGRDDTSERAPTDDTTLGGGGPSPLTLTCWCDTEQGTGDGSGCIIAVASGSPCSGECSCGDICGALQTF